MLIMILMDFCGIIVHSFFSLSPVCVVEVVHKPLRFVLSGAELLFGGAVHQEPSLGSPGKPKKITRSDAMPGSSGRHAEQPFPQPSASSGRAHVLKRREKERKALKYFSLISIPLNQLPYRQSLVRS